MYPASPTPTHLLCRLRSLRQLFQFRLLLIRQLRIKLIEPSNILRRRAHKEVRKVSLRLVVALAHEASSQTLSIGHQVRLCGTRTEVQNGWQVLPSVVVFFVCEVCGSESGGSVLDARGGEELFDEDLDYLQGGGDYGVLVRI